MPTSSRLPCASTWSLVPQCLDLAFSQKTKTQSPNGPSMIRIHEISLEELIFEMICTIVFFELIEVVIFMFSYYAEASG
jgi:hypothetical protein